MFTKEHYIEIAKILKKNEETNPYLCTRKFQSMTVRRFVLMLESDCSEFNEEKFLDAIYGKEAQNGRHKIIG